MSNCWIQTSTGIRFNPVNPHPTTISINDIARALSKICRFTGHTWYFYSVAEHCVHVSRLCPPEDQLWGLLHDASEAYLSDIATPVKRLPEMSGYRKLEKNLQRAICKRFSLSSKMPDSVVLADNIALASEMECLMNDPEDFEIYFKKVEMMKKVAEKQFPHLKIPKNMYKWISGWKPEDAEDKFLETFDVLMERKKVT